MVTRSNRGDPAPYQPLMRPAPRQLIGVPDSRPQQPAEFIPREFMSALRAAAQAAPQATAPQATAPPQAAVAPQAEPQVAAPKTQLTGNPNVPRGYRNNNPLNIIDGSFARGQPGYEGTDGRFGRFASMDDGINAADRLLQSYADRGLNTPQSIIARWAPAGDGDNNPSAYGATIARNLGVEPGAAIDMANPAVRRQLIDAMATVENGRPMSPPKLADGGLIDLARKYADGGSVVGSAQVYDPAVIAAIAASIVEPQGYADGGTATGVSSDDATPPDYSGQYNTVLSEKLETEFQSLIKQIGRQRDLADYDMRGAFAAGQLKPDGRGHLTSQFKKPNHPTFSQDSIWNGFDGYTGGHWRQDAKQSWSFTPSATNLNMHGIGGLRDYWDKQEAPAGNVLNMGRIPFAAGGYVRGYAEGGVTTGVSSDETAPVPEQVQAPRTFADLVGRYGVGDAMQVAAPLDDQSLGAGVLPNIGNYLRPVGQGLLEILPTVKNYAIDVATGPKPFTRLGSDISTLGSAVWEGVKEDPVGTVLDILPVVGEVRSAMDAHELRNKAEAAERVGDEKQAAMFRQLSALASAGAIPLAGMGVRAANRGVKLGVEGAEVAARAGASGVEQAVETAAREGAAKSVEAAKFAGKAGSTPKEMAALLDDVRGTQIGKMADRYNSLPGEEATQLLYQDLKGLAVEGNVGKEWYERSSDRILEFVGGNKDQADKFAQLIAIYSPQTSVDVNTQNAMKSYNRAIVGEQIWNGTIINPEITFKTIAAANRYMKELGGLKAGVTKVPLDDSGKRFLIAKHDQIGSYDNISTLDRDLKAHLVMNENIPFEGRKINNFYNNLMVQIDPSRLQGSTQDLWMARAFGFLDDAVGSGAKYDFMERMTADLAKEMNWKPHQIQAAIWVAMKTRQESVKDSVRAAALEQGIAKNVSDPKSPNNMVFQVIDGNEAQYANILREASLGANITEEAIALAARNFSDFLDQNLAYVSW